MRVRVPLLEPLSKILDVSINEIFAGEKIDNKRIEEKTNENILNITKKEIENFKAIKMGMLSIIIVSLILVIFGVINNLNINGYLMLLASYNCVYMYYKYKYCRDKNNLTLSIVWFACSILFFTSYAISIIDLSLKEIVSYIIMMLFGILIISLGIMNYRGNISTIHWYNRRKVSKENESKYGKYMRIGTIIIGSSLTITSILQMLYYLEIFFYIIVIGIIVGLIFMLYSQIKYNKGIF